MKKTLTASLLGALLLTASACGGSGGSSSTDAASSTRSTQDVKASKSISASIMKGQKAATGSSQLFSMSQKDADCIGNGLVDKIGVKQLQTYKLLDKNLKINGSVTNAKMSAKDAGSASDVLFGCTDVQGMMKQAITKSGNLPPAVKPCIDKTFTESNLKSAFTELFQGHQAAIQKQLAAPLMKCAMQATGGGSTTTN
jgi:hypothetical protein